MGTHEPPLREGHVVKRDLRTVVVGERRIGYIEPIHRRVPDRYRHATRRDEFCAVAQEIFYSQTWADAPDASVATKATEVRREGNMATSGEGVSVEKSGGPAVGKEGGGRREGGGETVQRRGLEAGCL